MPRVSPFIPTKGPLLFLDITENPGFARVYVYPEDDRTFYPKLAMAAVTTLSLKKALRPPYTEHILKAWHQLLRATSASNLTHSPAPSGVGRGMPPAGIVLHGQLRGGKFETAGATWKSRSNWET